MCNFLDYFLDGNFTEIKIKLLIRTYSVPHQLESIHSKYPNLVFIKILKQFDGIGDRK